MLYPTAPLFLESVEFVDIPPADFLLPWWLSSLLSKVRILHHGCTTRFWHRWFLYINPQPSLWLGPGIPYRDYTQGQSKRGLLMSLCQRPVDLTIKTTITRRNSILNVVKEGILRSLDFIMLPGNTIRKDMQKYPYYQPV